MVGCLPALQANQLIQIFRDLVFIEQGIIAPGADPFYYNLSSGIILAALTAMVIFGGLQRIARTATVLCHSWPCLYLATIVFALLLNAEQVPAAFGFILRDAFTGEAAAGGSLLAMMIYGVQRGRLQQ